MSGGGGGGVKNVMRGRRVRNDTLIRPRPGSGNLVSKVPPQNHEAYLRSLEPKAQVLRKSEAGLEVLPGAARFADSACDEGDEVEGEMSPALDAFRNEVPMWC